MPYIIRVRKDIIDPRPIRVYQGAVSRQRRRRRRRRRRR